MPNFLAIALPRTLLAAGIEVKPMRFAWKTLPARTFAILGACGTLLWVMLSVLGYVHEEPRVALQQAGPLMAVALPR